jgi:flagellar hook-associated protein 1 FlgK
LISNITWDDGATFNVTSGEIAGLLETRVVVNPAQQSVIDDLASSLITRINSIHRSGFGLNNIPGLDFFDGIDSVTINVALNMEQLEDIVAAVEDPDNPGKRMTPGDGTTARQFAAVQYELLLGAGTMTLNEVCTNQVATLGMEILHLANNLEAHQLVGGNLNTQYESYSGVSLDEEASNLIVLQRSYQAAARLLTAIDEIIE